MVRSARLLSLTAVAAGVVLPGALDAQGGRLGPQEPDAYFVAVAEHFGVTLEEVGVLREWRLSPDEIPVVLFLSQRAGVPPDVVVAFHRNGRGWMEVAERYGISADDFYLPMEGAAGSASLARAYGQFSQLPSGDWASIRLDDAEVVAMVNVRVLSRQLGLPPARVLEMGERAGSFAAALSGFRP